MVTIVDTVFKQHVSTADYASVVIAIFGMSVCLSVRPSVCPSVTRFDTESKRRMLGSWNLYRRTDSLRTLVLETQSSLRNSNESEVGKVGDFRPLSRRISESVQERSKGCYWSLIGSRIGAFDWCRNQRRWMAITHCFTIHAFSEPTMKIWLKIDLHYEHQKYCTGTLISGYINFFVDIRAGSLETWANRQWSGRKRRFSVLLIAISFKSLGIKLIF